MMNNSTKILNEAKKILTEKGWGRGKMYGVDMYGYKNFCLMGAIQEAGDKLGFDNGVKLEAEIRVDRAVESRHKCSVFRFNDDIAKSKKDVLSIIDYAKKRKAYQP